MNTRKSGERRRVSPQAFERTLVNAAQNLTSRLDLKAVCEALVDAAAELVGATSSLVLLRDVENRTLRFEYGRGPVADLAVSDPVPTDEHDPASVVLTNRQNLFVPVVQKELRWLRASPSQRNELQSLLFVPLVSQDDAIGVLVLQSPYLSRRSPPRADDLARLASLAAQASIALTNARFYEESERDRGHFRALLEERRQLRGHVHELRKEVNAATSCADIVGVSAALRRVLAQVQVVAPADATVLLLGETGTGKELLARAIHARSRRATKPFVAVNCAALPAALVESELFGHERGAFTDAVAPKPGRFEVAHRGTLLLDEIGDLPLEAQGKVLRTLQEGEVQRIGGIKIAKVDVRIIAATNTDLAAAVARKAFRSDLYYRLSVFPIAIPPLRERPDDIPVLALHFVRHFAGRMGKNLQDIDPSAMDLLTAYRWPGNVRELQNVIERAVILTNKRTLTADALAIAPIPTAATTRTRGPVVSLVEAQRRAVLAALRRANWRISGAGGAAELLGLKATTLHGKMKKLGVRRPRGS